MVGLVAFGLVAVAPATAAHHLVKVREVFPGTTANPTAEYVELQLPASGENLVANQARVDLANADGSLTNTATFPANPPNGQSQRTMLAATASAATLFGVTADLTLPTADVLGPSGAACFNSSVFGPLDCVTTASPSGSPAAAIPDGSSLTRSIAAGCATLLELGDDTNSSVADFAVTSPTPQNNAATPAEVACGAPGSDGGTAGDADPPNTKIKRGPKGTVESDTATVKFKSTEQGSTFECKLDRNTYKSCRSPKKLKNLDDGKHKFKVRATDAAGNSDPTPAKLRWRVVS